MMNKKTDNAGSGQRILLAVSFGTSFEDTREKTIGAIETRIGERIPHYTVQRCFTSRIIRKKLLERDGLRIDSPEEAVLAARQRGIRELAVQPLYLMHGLEHRRLMAFLHKEAAGFDRLSIGEPLLSEDADLRIMADAICRHLPVKTPDTAVVLMGHGNAVSDLAESIHETMSDYLNSYIWHRVWWILGMIVVACVIVMLFDRGDNSTSSNKLQF